MKNALTKILKTMKIFLKILAILSLFLALNSQIYAKAYYYDDYERFNKVIKINTYANKLSYYEK
ncbi:MAG: hypothetical protein LBF15_00835 [Candidatus Peribacteria bacterium]|jgi:hypothetical protein|nr:hypothetical protein [Candidatus Peribacteria bacterium]